MIFVLTPEAESTTLNLTMGPLEKVRDWTRKFHTKEKISCL